jgi:stearoyl-CoA desaturase (delta-9 desaturase)
MAAVIFAAIYFWSHGISWFDLTFAVGMYVITGFGVTLGLHRYLTHRSFRPKRWLKLALTIAGAMALEGSPISWVAQHRRHHVLSDKTGDPHSPWAYGINSTAQLKGLWHAHTGWLLCRHEDEPTRWCPDLLQDQDIRWVSRLTPLWFALTFAFPFGIGYSVAHTLWGAFLTGLWAGLVRACVLHHVTWSINSVCHMFGKRPFRTADRSTNFAPLALLSFGESWHNAHHAFPALARHGVERGQIDLSAGAIRVFERCGWVTDVKWPTPEKLALRKIVLDSTK